MNVPLRSWDFEVTTAVRAPPHVVKIEFIKIVTDLVCYAVQTVLVTVSDVLSCAEVAFVGVQIKELSTKVFHIYDEKTLVATASELRPDSSAVFLEPMVDIPYSRRCWNGQHKNEAIVYTAHSN